MGCPVITTCSKDSSRVVCPPSCSKVAAPKLDLAEPTECELRLPTFPMQQPASNVLGTANPSKNLSTSREAVAHPNPWPKQRSMSQRLLVGSIFKDSSVSGILMWSWLLPQTRQSVFVRSTFVTFWRGTLSRLNATGCSNHT